MSLPDEARCGNGQEETQTLSSGLLRINALVTANNLHVTVLAPKRGGSPQTSGNKSLRFVARFPCSTAG